MAPVGCFVYYTDRYKRVKGGDTGCSSGKMERMTEEMNRVTNAETADSAYKSLYILGGVAALIAAVLILSEVISV